MNRSFFTILIATLVSLNAYATGEKTAVGGAQNGMGKVYTTHSDVFSALNNQAGLAFTPSSGIGLYSRLLHGDLGLNETALAGMLKTNSGTLGLSARYVGFSLYNETLIGIGYGRKFGERFGIGLQLDLISLSISEAESQSALTFELGFLYRVNDKITLAGHAYNPMRIVVDQDTDETFSSSIAIGADYSLDEKVQFALEIEKDIDYPVTVKGGIAYYPVERIALRAGISTSPSSYHGGVGVRLKNFTIDFAASMHPTLGVTPHLGLNYRFQ